MQRSVKSERLLYLDGLRGIAATIVYFNHFVAAFFPAIIFGQKSMLHVTWERVFYVSPLGIITNGNFAVHLFLALTAFVMLRKIYQSKTTLRIMAVVGRYLRLMIPIAASSLIAYILLRESAGVNIVAAGLSHSPWLIVQWPETASLWVAIRQGIWDAMWVNASTYNSNLWMLHYIWYGSLVAFGIGAFVRWPRIRVAIYIAGFILSSHTVFSAFWMGALVFHYHERLLVAAQKFPHINIFSSALLILGIILGSTPIILGDIPSLYDTFLRSNMNMSYAVNTIHVFAAGLTFVAIFINPHFQKVLRARSLVVMGRLGFSTYLLHVLLISSLASWLLVRLSSLPYLIATGWAFLATSVTLAVASVLFHKFVEKPSERFARWVASM